VIDGTPTLGASAGSWWLRGAVAWSLPLLIEAAAQASARLLAPEAGSASGQTGGRWLLAGVESAQLLASPRAGERVTLGARLVARLGGVVKVEAEVKGEDGELARLVLLLSAAPLGR